MKKKNNKKRMMNVKTDLEEMFLKQIKQLNKKGKVGYEEVRLPYTLQRNYWPDFICSQPGRPPIYIEAKGYLRPSDRSKLLAVLREDPTIDLRMAFGANNKLNKNSPTRYGDWCDKHGIPWCVGKIPKEWFA